MDELNHGAGKGDKERSAGWRKNYDEIDFRQRLSPAESDGFMRRGNRLVKCYTAGRKAVFNFPEAPACPAPPYPLPCGGLCDHPGVESCSCPSSGLLEKERGWCCTLAKGHAGPHIACCGGICDGLSPWNHRLHSWPQQDTKL
jgi:hypothetical protein